MTEPMAAPADAVVLLDRFVSASSSDDAVESLQGMLDGFQNKTEVTWKPSWIWQHEDVADHLADPEWEVAEQDKVYLIVFELWRRLLPQTPTISGKTVIFCTSLALISPI